MKPLKRLPKWKKTPNAARAPALCGPCARYCRLSRNIQGMSWPLLWLF
jgi:hypothetical protein